MSRVDLNDFAIVTLEDFSFKGDPLIISKKILRFGERVRMVGHGQHFPKKPVDTDEVFSTYFGKWRAVPELPYQKSVGTNQAVELYNTLPKNTYRFYAMGGKFDGVEHYKSGIFPGDSGGPLVNESGEIVGVAHKISFSGGTVLTSTFLDVTRPDVREIIENKISKDNVML